MKKLLSLVLALAMILALAAPVFADDGTGGSITINGTEDVSVSGRTFNAYKILDVVSYTNDSVVYAVPAAMKDFYNARYSLTGSEGNYDYLVAKKIEAETNMETFVKAALDAAKKAYLTPVSATGNEATNTAVFNDLPLGYYVIEDVSTGLEQGHALSALMLDTTNLNPKITIKASKTTLEKKIDGNNDQDNDSTGKVDANKGNIGDKVPYELTTKVPDLRGYTNYIFVVNDTLSKGLTFNDDVAITVGTTQLTRYYSDDAGKYYSNADLTNEVARPLNAYTVTSVKNADGTTSVEIVFVNFYNSFKSVAAGTAITITYSAVINEDAEIGVAGNPNAAKLTYSNNPAVNTGNDKPGPDDVTGTTPEDKTYTYVTGIELLKVDPEGNTLTGATFNIKGEKQNKYVVYYEEFVEAADGTYYKLNDGTYTMTAPTDATKELYDSTTTTYKLVEKSKTETMAGETVSFDAEVGADGVLKVTGMEAGTYTITEIKAPTGYNLLDAPITLAIDWTAPANVDMDSKCTWSLEENESTEGWKFDDNTGVFKITVVNNTGTELPGTGGIGTTIFYVVGAILVAAAVILLITKKRTSVEG